MLSQKWKDWDHRKLSARQWMAPNKKGNRIERRTNPPNARGRVPVGGGWKRAGEGGERKLRRQKECGRLARHAHHNVYGDNDNDNHQQLQHEMEHEHEPQHGCGGNTAVRGRQLGTWKHAG